MFGNVPRELPQQIALVLVPRFSFLPFSGMVESFRLANRLSGQELYRRILVSADFAEMLPETPFRALGEHRLRGVSTPERVFEPMS